MIRKTLPLTILILITAILMAACGTTDPFIVSGQSLASGGDAFLEVARAYDRALAAKVVTTAQYNAWKKVGLEIQASYGPAVDSWQAAVAINDAVKITEAKARITAIVAELAQYGAVVGVQVYDLVNKT